MVINIKDVSLHYTLPMVENAIRHLETFPHDDPIPPPVDDNPPPIPPIDETPPPPIDNIPPPDNTPPPSGDLPSNIFVQRVSFIDYRETSQGKTLTVQIQYTKEREEFNISNAQALIQVKSQEHGTHLTESKDLQIGGASQFGTSFNIPDVPVGQPSLTVECFLLSGGVPIALKIIKGVELNANNDQPPIPPPSGENKSLGELITEDPVRAVGLGLFGTAIVSFLKGALK